MSQGGGDALSAAVVEGHHATVGEWQLQFTLCLLAGYFARYRAVHLVGKPVFAGHGLELKYVRNILVETLHGISRVIVCAHDGLITHDGLGRVAEHLRHVEVERLHAIALPETEMRVARGLSHDIQRCAFALGNAFHAVEMFLVDEQSHAFLTLVGDDFLGRERLVADGQLGHVYLASALLDQFREAVEVSCRPVVVYRHHRVDIIFDQRAHEVVRPFLHLGVGTLHGVQLNAVAVTAGIYRRHGAAAKPDAVIVTAYDHDFVARLWLFLQAVTFFAVAYATCQHDDLIITVDRSCRTLGREWRAVGIGGGIGR